MNLANIRAALDFVERTIPSDALVAVALDVPTDFARLCLYRRGHDEKVRAAIKAACPAFTVSVDTDMSGQTYAIAKFAFPWGELRVYHWPAMIVPPQLLVETEI